MNARSTRGPGGGRHGGRRPPVRRTSGRKSTGGACLLMVAAALAVISTAVIVTPLAAKVATRQWIPAADRAHWGDLAAPAVALAMFALYLVVSVLFVHRRTYSPAGSAPALRGAGTGRPGVPVLVAARGEQRSEDPAAGVSASPGLTPAATTTAAAVSSNAAVDGTDIASQRAGRRQEEVAGRHVTPGGAS